MTDRGRYFVVLLGPNRPMVITEEDGETMALWKTPDEAQEALKNHRAVQAFGAEIFELGTAENEI